MMLFLFLFSIVLRLLFLNAGLFHHDSVQLAVAVEDSLMDKTLHPIGGGRYGLVLVNSIIFYFFNAFLHHKSAEFAVNFSSALFGALAIPLLYLFVKYLSNNQFISVASSMLYSVSPIFLSVSTFANSHSLSMFLVLLSFYFLINSIKSNRKILALYSGIFIGFSLLVRESNLLLLPAAFYLLFFYSENLNKNISSNEKKKLLLYYITPVSIAILALLFLISPILEQQLRRNFGTFVFDQLAYSVSGILATFTWLGIILAILGIYAVHKSNKSLLAFLFVWLTPLFVFYAFSSSVDHRFFSEAFIPMAVLIPYSLEIIGRDFKYASIMILAVLLIWMFAGIYPAINARHEASSMKGFSGIIKEKLEPDAVIILYGDNQAFLKYYGNISTLPCEPDLDMGNSKEFVGVVYSYLINGIPAYISTECFSLGNMEEKQHFYNLMLYNFKFKYEFEYFFDNYHKSLLKQDILKNYLLKVLPYPDDKGELLSEYMYYPE